MKIVFPQCSEVLLFRSGVILGFAFPLDLTVLVRDSGDDHVGYHAIGSS